MPRTAIHAVVLVGPARSVAAQQTIEVVQFGLTNNDPNFPELLALFAQSEPNIKIVQAPSSGSGSGKTTILRLLAGLVPAERGAVYLDDHEISRLPPERRGMAMIHQRFLLFPHLTVRANVAFGLPYRGVRRAGRGRGRRAAHPVARSRHPLARPDAAGPVPRLPAAGSPAVRDLIDISRRGIVSLR